MPLIALRSLLGTHTSEPLSFRDTVMVRYWEEAYPNPAEFAALERQAGKGVGAHHA
jgi:hypothetical protein